MQGIQRLLRSQKFGLLHRFRQPEVVRAFSTSPNSGSTDNNQSHESIDDFERRIFGDMNAGGGGSTTSDSFFQKLDRVEKAHDRSGLGSSKFNFGKRSDLLDGLDDSFTTLTDGMGRKLKKAAMFFDIDPEEVNKDDYAYRPDISFRPGSTYETKDLDLTKPGIRKPFKRQEFEVTTKEVLRKADFRNVRFLANFITESGIIIKRSKTGISAKAQRKVAREIKTARAFGLMPFTTMGTKHFVFGKTMEDLDEDYEYDTAYSFVDNGPVGS